MKQRTRIRRIKEQTYPAYIYRARQRRMWAVVRRAVRSLGAAIQEAYEKARREREMSEVPEGREEPGLGKQAGQRDGVAATVL